MSGLLNLIMTVIRILFARNAESSSQDSTKNETETTTANTISEVEPPEQPEVLPYANIEFKNSSTRLETEFMELKSKNNDLHNILIDCGNYCEKEFKKNIVITMIYRTQEEQNEIYKDNPKYQQKKFKSPHQLWHGADLRSRVFSKGEIDQLVQYLNDKYNNLNYYKFTAMCHDVGLGDHFHLQFVRK